MSQLLSKQEHDLLLANAKGMTRKQLYRWFVEKTGSEIEWIQFKNWIDNRRHEFSPLLETDHRFKLMDKEQIRWMYENCQGKTVAELTKEFNRKFHKSLTQRQIRGWLNSHSEVKNQMKNRGITPQNEIETRNNLHCIGTVSKNEKGWRIKVSDGSENDWQTLSRMVWENAYGYTPNPIFHLDGNNLNCSLENLCPCSTKARGYILKKWGWVYDNPDLMKSRILSAELKIKVKENGTKSSV